ncbi:hypothetical protein ACFL2M_00130 [Patescibacteria group bacterium]
MSVFDRSHELYAPEQRTTVTGLFEQLRQRDLLYRPLGDTPIGFRLICEVDALADPAGRII